MRVDFLVIQVPGLNVITEYMMGYILPGQPIANVCFKTYGYISMTQAVSFLQDFKLGHYMKIPPRSMFIVQVPNYISSTLLQFHVLSIYFFHCCVQILKISKNLFPFPHPGNFQMSSTQLCSNFTKSKSLRSFSYIYEMLLLLNTTYLYVTKRIQIMGKETSLDVKTVTRFVAYLENIYWAQEPAGHFRKWNAHNYGHSIFWSASHGF